MSQCKQAAFGFIVLHNKNIEKHDCLDIKEVERAALCVCVKGGKRKEMEVGVNSRAGE